MYACRICRTGDHLPFMITVSYLLRHGRIAVVGGLCWQCISRVYSDCLVECECCRYMHIPQALSIKYCNDCRDDEERSVVVMNNRRTTRLGLIGDLTLLQWKSTLRYFDYSCAYCRGPYEVLEHFMPVSFGGITSVSNCVPACFQCNTAKAGVIPDDCHSIDISRAYDYLKKKRK